MADNSQPLDDNFFEDLGLPGKEFILPDLSSPWLLEDFAVYPNVSDKIELEPYPTAILDDSCISEVMSKPSIPLVESVEAFFLGLTDNSFGHSSVKPNVDVLMNNQESFGLHPVEVKNAECHGVSSGYFHNHTVQSEANISIADFLISSSNPEQLLDPVTEKFRTLSAKNRRKHHSTAVVLELMIGISLGHEVGIIYAVVWLCMKLDRNVHSDFSRLCDRSQEAIGYIGTYKLA
uniref:Uncharacterized protein n=1 Tax=Chenopodium quinoa TaxID=63459 RepID=A0A803KM77_CHEQI